MKKLNPKTVAKGTEPKLPEDLRKALSVSCVAETAWKELTQVSRRDFISWINEAKQEQTRQRRIERCIQNIEKGKKRPCCYAVVPMDLYKALGESPKAKTQWSALTANEKRDFSDWVESANNKEERKSRIAIACTQLVSGKRNP